MSVGTPQRTEEALPPRLVEEQVVQCQPLLECARGCGASQAAVEQTVQLLVLLRLAFPGRQEVQWHHLLAVVWLGECAPQHQSMVVERLQEEARIQWVAVGCRLASRMVGVDHLILLFLQLVLLFVVAAVRAWRVLVLPLCEPAAHLSSWASWPPQQALPQQQVHQLESALSVPLFLLQLPRRPAQPNDVLSLPPFPLSSSALTLTFRLPLEAQLLPWKTTVGALPSSSCVNTWNVSRALRTFEMGMNYNPFILGWAYLSAVMDSSLVSAVS
mmetsp:Transcript_11499/g.15973  ORF Transcript_11499/g.15973 Transcript_11499/m.15973 type:complete len:272 (-) Transcript_11499:46-861(-)